MSGARTTARRSRGTIIGVVSVVAVVGTIAALAVTAQGFDAQEVPKLESSVWVTRDAGQYARVNTDLGEIDTVRSVEDPSGVVQSGSQSLLFTQGYRKSWPVDAASPADVSTDPAASSAEPGDADQASQSTGTNTPAGTHIVASAGDYVIYLTDTGKVFLDTLQPDQAGAAKHAAAMPIDPFAATATGKKAAPSYVASAVTVSDDGRVAIYSAAEHAIRSYDAKKQEFIGSAVAVPSPPDADAHVELATISGHWVLSDPADKRVWIDGRSAPVSTGLKGDARLQSSSAVGDRVYLADSASLIAIDLGSGAVTKAATASGTPAAPQAVDGVVYAAWLSESGGTLWSSTKGRTTPLKTDGKLLDDVKSIVPIFRSNGQRAVLSEESSGMLWTVPDGTLIPVEQWSLDDTEKNPGTVQVDDVAQEKPPIAVADAFGVRSGQMVSLPVLLNDYDPNKKDVLTVAPASISGGLSNAAFGDLGLVSNNQQAVIRVRAQSGSATFSYAATDGAATSTPATVTLTIVPESQNTAPKWCGVDSCVQKWPTPQIAPGGTITVPVLSGWVDPEGDAFVLSDARKDNPSDPVTVVPTANGSVAIRHLDPNSPGATIPITVTVTDSRGAVATKTLELVVAASPALVVSPAAVVTTVGEKTSFSIADHVSGGSGSFRLVDAVVTSVATNGLVVVPNAAAGQIDLNASAAGEYAVTYSVQDTQTQSEQSATLRVTVAAGAAPLTMAPITAFVRPNEDTTVDVLRAVQNTTGRVLIVSSATTTDPALSVGVVGQSSVRVSSPNSDGKPGWIGNATITVTDGTGAAVEGLLSVFLVDSSTGIGPIAVPDAVTVRAGSQVDIPVLANDVSPRGERVLLHPQIQGSGTSGELAFAAGDDVRYLAPQKSGVYTLHYSVYLENEPARLDSATITVTVLPDGSNRPPQPAILSARVVSGQSVSIPVDSYGTDPDGDAVVLSSVAQPKTGQGTASISADGAAIIYTAPAGDVDGGQVSFAYSVRDSQGADATSSVRVGILASKAADTVPVTYSDYVRVQQNSTTPLTIQPLLNDSDPAQGTLTLVDLVPNAPSVQGNPEYARLKSLIDPRTQLKQGVVMLGAGDVLGTHSYIYTVRSSVSSSTAQGLIVITVSAGASPDHPEVTDTVLTAKNRTELADGIDVVSGKVQWPSGNIAGLKLALWGDAASHYSVSGHSISGTLPKKGDIVPFSLTGTDSGGGKVVSYGFLRIPAFNDMRLQLRESVKPLKVDEDKSVDFDIRTMLDLDSADAVEVRHDASYPVQRTNAKCVLESGTTIVYQAGREAPWSDSCSVPVRLVGQSDWTVVSVPVIIAPKTPQAELNPVTRTIAPGVSETVDLYQAMTTWEGDRVGDKSQLDYSESYSGSAFAVTLHGTTVTVDTRADAAPGTRETIQIAVSHYGGLSAPITLIVGIAPADAPRGATLSHQCDVSHGASCAIAVTGVSGEYDPFAGKAGSGLRVTSLGSGGAANCPVATMSISGTSQVVASWPSSAKPAGGECVVPFTVTDAQGRTGPGLLTLDILGYPQTPASLTTKSYTGSTVTLSVALGEAAQAHPALTGVSIWEGGKRVTANCDAAGQNNYECTVSGLKNGEHHDFTARAENSVGASLDTTAATTWAYQVPGIKSLTVTPVYSANNPATSATQGAVELDIVPGEGTTSFQVNDNSNSKIYTHGEEVTATVLLPVGQQTVSVTPISDFNPPAGADQGSAVTRNVTVAGSPYFSSTTTPTVKVVNTTTVLVSGMDVFANFSNNKPVEKYLAWKESDASPTCSVTSDGGLQVQSGEAIESDTSTIEGLTSYTHYKVMACASNGYGIVASDVTSTYTGVLPAPPTGLGYTISDTTVGLSSIETYELTVGPAVNPPQDFKAVFTTNGTDSDTFTLDPNVAAQIFVKYCSIQDPTFCSDPATLSSNALTTATVTFPVVGGCVPEPSAQTQVSAGAKPYSEVVVNVNLDAGQTGEVNYSLSWKGSFSGLENVSSTFPIC